jgi:hypothetical protein
MAFAINAQTLRSLVDRKFLVAVLVMYTCSHLIHVEHITGETDNADAYPDANKHLALQKPLQTVVSVDGSSSLGASENSRWRWSIGRRRSAAAGSVASGDAGIAKDQMKAQGRTARSGRMWRPAGEEDNELELNMDGTRMLCSEPLNVAALVKAHYCESRVDPAAMDGLQGIPLRPFLPTPTRYSLRHRRRDLLDANSGGDGDGDGDGDGNGDADADDTSGESEGSGSANAVVEEEDASEDAGFAEVELKVSRGLAPAPGSGQVFVHGDNARLFGRGLGNLAATDPNLIPPDEAAAMQGHQYRTCAVVGSSGILRKTAYGAMIDAADAVFRVNQAPTLGGCALYAGSRTSVRVINARCLHKYSHASLVVKR